MKNNNLILTMDFIPKESLEKNLHDKNNISLYQWNLLSAFIREQSKFICEICQKVQKIDNVTMHCHEVWEFNDIEETQKLVKLQCICQRCHYIKHYAFFSEELWFDLELSINHFIEVNKATREEFSIHLVEAIKIWQDRSLIKWKIQVEETLLKYEEVIEYYPERRKRYVNKVKEMIKNNETLTPESVVSKLGKFKGIKSIIKDANKELGLEKKLRILR